MGRIFLGAFVVACVVGTAACADSTAPATATKQVPMRSANTRYILASGDVPPAGCRDLGNGYWVCDEPTNPAVAQPAAPTAPSTPPQTTAQ